MSVQAVELTVAALVGGHADSEALVALKELMNRMGCAMFFCKSEALDLKMSKIQSSQIWISTNQNAPNWVKHE